MPENSIQYMWDGAKGLFVFLLGMFGWQIRRQVKRVDDLEKNSVTNETFNNAVNSLREDFKSHANRMEAGITRTHERMDKFLNK